MTLLVIEITWPRQNQTVRINSILVIFKRLTQYIQRNIPFDLPLYAGALPVAPLRKSFNTCKRKRNCFKDRNKSRHNAYGVARIEEARAQQVS